MVFYDDAIDDYHIPDSTPCVYEHCVEADLVDSIIKDFLSEKAEPIICGDEIIGTWIMCRMQAMYVHVRRDTTHASLFDSTYLECFSPAVIALSVSAQRMGRTICTEMMG